MVFLFHIVMLIFNDDIHLYILKEFAGHLGVKEWWLAMFK